MPAGRPVENNRKKQVNLKLSDAEYAFIKAQRKGWLADLIKEMANNEIGTAIEMIQQAK